MSTELVNMKNDNASLFAPENFDHSWRLAQMLAKSQFAPKAFYNKPEDCLIAMEYGRCLNLAPLPAIQNIAVVNGKPALYADGLLAVCSGRADFENIIEQRILDNGVVVGYECVVKRKNREAVQHIFTKEDAQKAGLWGKAGPWTQYPQRMLQMRARSWALRDCFADALSGVQCLEELRDYQEEKDITPKSTGEQVKDNLKSLLTSAKPKQEQEQEQEQKQESKPVPTVTLDQLTEIRDIIKLNNISIPIVKECLEVFNVKHIEHLMTEQVDELLCMLVEKS